MKIILLREGAVNVIYETTYFHIMHFQKDINGKFMSYHETPKCTNPTCVYIRKQFLAATYNFSFKQYIF